MYEQGRCLGHLIDFLRDIQYIIIFKSEFECVIFQNIREASSKSLFTLATIQYIQSFTCAKRVGRPGNINVFGSAEFKKYLLMILFRNRKERTLTPMRVSLITPKTFKIFSPNKKYLEDI